MIQMENINKYMFQKIDELLKNGSLNNKKIVLFGLNTSSYAAKEYLETRQMKVFAYVDNDRRKIEEMNDFIEDVLPRHMRGSSYKTESENLVKAYYPETLLGKFDDGYAILIASKYYVQMKEQLQKMGYIEKKHIYQIVDFYGLDEQIGEYQAGIEYREMTADEVRQVQLDILKQVKKICTEQGLRYYLCGGTLIGAVRHKGYIPWDDDIDVIMPYQDYLKFINYIDKNSKEYAILSPYNNSDKCFTFFARMIKNNTIMKWWEYPFLMTSGVSIDIFALSGLPEREDEIQYFYNKVRRLNTKFISSFLKMNPDEEAEKKRREMIRMEILSMLEQYQFDTSKKAFCISKYKEKEILPTALYKETQRMLFEGEEYNVAAGYDIYLKSLYGDYMKLPPENQRTGCHSYRAYIIR